MKLLTKTNLYYILFSLITFIIGGSIFYVFISNDIYEDADESLAIKKDQIEDFIKKKDTLPDLSRPFDSLVFVSEVNAVQPDRFTDTTFFSKEEGEDVDYRALIFMVKYQDTIYKYVITKSQIESDDIIESIIYSMSMVFVILLIVLVTFNYFLSRNIWKPFYKTLKSLENFDLTNNKDPDLGESRIAEFRKLNDALKKMTTKMLNDFSIQKEFSENASHEMQTPLAIIKSKLELLIQSESLSETQAKLLQEISDTTNRLSRINQALLLIAKIENKQYPAEKDVDITAVIKKHVLNFEELISQKNIETRIALQSPFYITMNPLLADVLVTNLIANAIKHNIRGGSIIISQNANTVIFENTGIPLNLDPGLLFDRFRKGRQHADSMGLGLSIVKKICENNHILIDYSFENGMHSFRMIL
jgi:signal transduction histidine kinase